MEQNVPVWMVVGLLGALQFLVAMLIMRLWKAIDDNTKGLQNLAVELPKSYATRESVHFLREQVGGRIGMLEVAVAQLQGGNVK